LWDCQQVSGTKPNGLGRPRKQGETPVGVGTDMGQDPEYHRTREIRWETGPTTVQG
jgi:hypothetical protein